MGIEKKQVKLTIGIPVYNGEKFLVEKITSILNQDFINFELKVDSVNNELGIIILKVKANKKSSERASSRLTVLRGKVICKKLWPIPRY